MQISNDELSPNEPQWQAEPVYLVPSAESEPPFQQAWWLKIITWCLTLVSANPLAAILSVALLVAASSLGAWVVALHLKNRVLSAQLNQPPANVMSQPEGAEVIQSRIEEARRQMSEIKGQMDQQQTEQTLNDKESLGAENARLIKELAELSKPHVNLPVIELDPASLLAAQNLENAANATARTPLPNDPAAPKNAAAIKDLTGLLIVPASSAMFTTILHQSTEKPYQNYFLELLDRKNNKVIWSGQQKKGTETNLSLTLVRRNYPAGKYRIRLSGMNGKKKEPIDGYDFQVIYKEETPLKKKKR